MTRRDVQIARLRRLAYCIAICDEQLAELRRDRDEAIGVARDLGMSVIEIASAAGITRARVYRVSPDRDYDLSQDVR
jgi:hypothetical protein